MGGTAVASAASVISGASPQTLPPLPYAENALEPVISAQTVSFHYGKHHRSYFDNLAKLTPNTPFAGQSLEALIVGSYGVPEHEAVFNNAAQAWNHNFYWQSLSPSPTRPSEALNAAIVRDFGSVDQVTSKLAAVSASQFGSGWGWLVAQRGKLAVIKTANADTPLAHGLVPLLTVDVWEHAYYLQYQNRRPEYLEHVMAKLINWDFASANFARMSA
ncbi:superoxide dismutase [Paraburkholderia kururiensis]|nr:superoxide dismutase [Paraburkholderia kururiensis]